MKSAWVDGDARKAVDYWAKTGIGPELAQRIYSTRLLGRDPKVDYQRKVADVRL